MKELDKCIMVCSNCHRELHNPDSTTESLLSLINKHEVTLDIKQKARVEQKYKYTLEELNIKKKN